MVRGLVIRAVAVVVPKGTSSRLFSCELGSAKDERKTGMTMTATGTVERRETASLIGSDKVDGTAVYGSDQKRIGSIQRIMIDKISGKVAYAVMSFGGFLGIGEDYYPVPWAALKYDASLEGYRVNFTNDQLTRAPKYSSSTDWNWNRENDKKVYDYYKARPYWTD
jgi:hypothetical protein